MDCPYGEVEFHDSPMMSCARAAENASAEMTKADESLNMVASGEVDEVATDPGGFKPSTHIASYSMKKQRDMGCFRRPRFLG